MKITAIILGVFLVSTAASAQSPDTSKWMCRNLADSGGFLYQGESIIGSQACRAIPQASVQPQPATSSATPQPATQATAVPAPEPQAVVPTHQANQPSGVASRQPRVFLQAASHGNTWNARRDQSMEMSKDFEKECPNVRVTVNQQMADYTVLLNHIEVGLFARDNQLQVADKNGDLLVTKEGGGIKGGVKKTCDLILANWSKQ